MLRYYEAATTACLLSPSFLCRVGRRYLGTPKDDVGSHKFPENPVVPLPCSRTPAEPRCLAFVALRYCPPTAERGGPRRPWSFRSSITRPQHWLFTLRAAITDDDAKLASGVWPIFPGGDSCYPLSSVGKFPPFSFPFPWASLVAIRSLLLNLLSLNSQPSTSSGPHPTGTKRTTDQN